MQALQDHLAIQDLVNRSVAAVKRKKTGGWGNT